MIFFFKKIWHDPVWSKVISAGIIAALAIYYSPIRQELKIYLWHFYAFILDKSELPNWLIGVLILIAAIFTIVLLVVIWESFQKKELKASWKNYREDNFFGVRWRWNFSSGTYDPYNISAYCIKCDYQIRPIDKQQHKHGTFFKCESCDASIVELPNYIFEIEDKVTRALQQKIRNDSWSNSLQ